jgi:hypothetical protein
MKILGFVQAKAAIALNGKIRNPVGFLLTVKCARRPGGSKNVNWVAF